MPKTDSRNLNHTGTRTFETDTFSLLDGTDQTIVAQFDISGNTTGTTRTFTLPDQSVQLAAANGTIETASTDATVGTVGSPASGTLTATFERFGSFFRLNFTLTAAQIPVTDGAGSGSYGTLKLLDFAAGGILYLGSRQDYTAYSPDGTGVPDDAVFEIGLGTTAISAAADGTLGATEDDIGGDVNQTLSGGTTTGTAHTNSSAVADGTATATDLNLNWSGTAATVDGNGTIDVTGTITVVGVLLGDD